MKQIVLNCAALLFFSALNLGAQPITLGLSLEKNTLVYSDSTAHSNVIDTLDFADHVLVIGKYDASPRDFNWNNWALIETDINQNGWVRFSDLAISRYLLYIATPTDTLYESPNMHSNFEFLTNTSPINILERSIINNETWLKLYYQYYQTKKVLWVKTRPGQYQVEDVYYNLVQNFWYTYDSYFYNLTPKKDYAKALQVALKLEHIISPLDTVFTSGEKGYFNKSGTGAFASYTLHQAYLKLEQFQNAIQSLKKIVELYSDQLLKSMNAGGYSSLKIGDIYYSKLNDIDNAITNYQFTVREFPGIEMFGYEWNDWADIRAAEKIISILHDSPERLYDESQTIISESQDSTVQLIGYRGKIRSLGIQGLYQAMIDTTFEILQKSPINSRFFFTFNLDFSVAIASTLLPFLTEELLFDKLFPTADRLKNQFKDYPVGLFSAYFLADIADKTNTDVEVVIKYYQDMLTMPDFNFYDPITFLNYGKYGASDRIAKISEYPQQNSEIISPETQLKFGYEDKYSILQTVVKGTKVITLYTNQFFVSKDSTQFTKVRLLDGTVGWLLSEHLTPLSNGPLVSNVLDEPGWNMALANAQNNPVFEGPGIENPMISVIVPNLDGRELRFFDLDGDLNLDLISRSRDSDKDIIALDGVSQKTLWSLDINYDFMILGNDKLYIKDGTGLFSRSFPRGTTLKCYNLKSKDLVWTRIDTVHARQSPLYFKNKLYDVFSDSFLVCLDALTGKKLWQKNLGSNQFFSGHRGPLAVNEIALVTTNNEFPSKLVAFNPQDGTMLWKSESPRNSYNIVIHDNHVYSFVSGSGVSINLETGITEWTFQESGDLIRAGGMGNLIVSGDKVFASSSRGLYALEKTDGHQIWKNSELNKISGMIGVGESIYFINDNQLLAVNQNTGVVLWELPIAPKRYGGLVYQSGSLYIEGAHGLLVISDSTTYNPTGSSIPDFKLSQNYPNPFNRGTIIQYNLREAQNVELVIYNMLGQIVKNLTNESQPKGRHQIVWDGTDNNLLPVQSGIYFYRIKIGDQLQSKSMVFVK